MTILRALVTLAAGLFAAVVLNTASNADCLTEQRQIRELTSWISGTGEGLSYEEGKTAAIADALSFFGVDVQVETSVTEDNTDAYATRNIRTQIDREAKGYEVLSHCKEGERHKVVAGIKKSTLVQMMSANAEARVKWADDQLIHLQTSNANLSDLKKQRLAYEQIIASEKIDLDSWLILGQPKSRFQFIPQHSRSKLLSMLAAKDTAPKQSVKILPMDDVAKKTMAGLMQRLNRDGISSSAAAAGDHDPVQWSCTVAKGTAVGRVHRILVRCDLSEPGLLDPVSLESMATASAADETAVSLITNRLNSSD